MICEIKKEESQSIAKVMSIWESKQEGNDHLDEQEGWERASLGTIVDDGEEDEESYYAEEYNYVE